MNKVGRLTIVNSVLSALQNNVMACTLLPCNVIDEMEKIMRSFFWGHNKGVKNLDDISLKKYWALLHNGGLGIRDLQTFNHALLCKRAWKTFQEGGLYV